MTTNEPERSSIYSALMITIDFQLDLGDWHHPFADCSIPLCTVLNRTVYERKEDVPRCEKPISFSSAWEDLPSIWCWQPRPASTISGPGMGLLGAAQHLALLWVGSGHTIREFVFLSHSISTARLGCSRWLVHTTHRVKHEYIALNRYP